MPIRHGGVLANRRSLLEIGDAWVALAQEAERKNPLSASIVCILLRGVGLIGRSRNACGDQRPSA